MQAGLGAGSLGLQCWELRVAVLGAARLGERGLQRRVLLAEDGAQQHRAEHHLELIR